MRAWLGLAATLLTMACTSGGSPAPATLPGLPPSPVATELADYRAGLEQAWSHIVAREGESLPYSIADPAAAASIEIPSHPSIDGAVRYFSTTLKESIQGSILRSSQYRTMIDGVLAEKKLPGAVAWLPVIESAYFPTLTSKAGARGIWQFMPATAREYGLRVDWWIDERNDPEKATRAAATYLSDLHRMFGDWSLALAAYNCGPGRVRRALEREGVTTFWELLERSVLPKETRGYVPTFWATVLIVSDPAAHGFMMSEPAAVEQERVEIEGPATLDYVATVAGIDPAVLGQHNPALHRGLVPPGRHILSIPPVAKAPLLASAQSLRFDDPDIPVTLYQIRSAETVASLARRLELDRKSLAEMNGLRSDRLMAGTTLYLPVSTTRLSETLARRHSDVPAIYVVERGDTLYAIARRHGLTVAELRSLNEIAENRIIHPGDRLQIGQGTVATGQ
ncbi:MAG: transglycosylase SLT domain-containing protein [Thermoanaerobaculia bacterium]